VTTDKIYLVGFMAAGKTTLARALATRLGWRILDVDQAIEARERLSVADIFVRHGEPYFRAAERDVLAQQLGVRHLVVATGGGTFVDPQNRAAINADGTSVWLDVPLELAMVRTPGGRRPLATDRSGFERLYHARRPAYQLAHIRLDAGRDSADALADELLDRLKMFERNA